jgi:hypothetical protein
MKRSKTKRCIKRGFACLLLGIKKATTYERVKHRLNYRFYNDEFLQARANRTSKDFEHIY